ncbi:MAG: alpha/beta hydrolase [Chloroflexota bacterium]
MKILRGEVVEIIHSDGRAFGVSVTGNAEDEAMVLLHGIGADHRMWAPQIQTFADQGYYVLAPDLLAHGETSKVEKLALKDWDDQIDKILAHFGLSNCILVGVSMGGVIAQSYAMNNPEKVRRLVLSDTFGELKTFQEKMLGYSQVIGFKIYKVLGGKLLAKGMASAYKAPFAKLAKAYFSEVSLRVDFDQLVLARKAINQIDAIGKINGEQIPTLNLVGDQFGKSFVEINRKISQGIKGSKFVILEHSMDPSNLVNPDDFNREVLQFLDDTA